MEFGVRASQKISAAPTDGRVATSPIPATAHNQSWKSNFLAVTLDQQRFIETLDNITRVQSAFLDARGGDYLRNIIINTQCRFVLCILIAF